MPAQTTPATSSPANSVVSDASAVLAKGGLATVELNGGCLCGGVKFVIAKGTTLRPLIACHCQECRRLSGSFVIATKVESAALSYKARETLSWHASSDWARRAFCRSCGSQLFYQIRRKSGGNRQENLSQENLSEENLDENLQALNSDTSISIMLGALALEQGSALPFVGHIFTSQAHPALPELSSSPMCERWGEQQLTDALAQQGWDTSKDDIERNKSL